MVRRLLGGLAVACWLAVCAVAWVGGTALVTASILLMLEVAGLIDVTFALELLLPGRFDWLSAAALAIFAGLVLGLLSGDGIEVSLHGRRRRDVPDTRTTAAHLVRLAQSAARGGDREEAHRLLLRAIRRNPRCAEAWLWLAAVSADPREATRCLERSLELNPADRHARRGLAALRGAAGGIPAREGA
jgi:tetratricopeptide (TPR) repeat protein